MIFIKKKIQFCHNTKLKINGHHWISTQKMLQKGIHYFLVISQTTEMLMCT